MRVVAVRVSVDVDVPARHELLRFPSRAPDQRRRAHLAAHLERLAVGVDGLEVQVRMRVDELELRQRARVVLEFLHLKQAEAVVSECGGSCRRPQAQVQRSGVSMVPTSCHGRIPVWSVARIYRAMPRGARATRSRPGSHAIRAAAGAYSRASRRRKPLVARWTRIRYLLAAVLTGAGPAAAQDGTAGCDSLCVAAAELVERFELREGAAPVRERAGWERPRRSSSPTCRSPTICARSRRASRSSAFRAYATTPAWPRPLPAPTC